MDQTHKKKILFNIVVHIVAAPPLLRYVMLHQNKDQHIPSNVYEYVFISSGFLKILKKIQALIGCIAHVKNHSHPITTQHLVTSTSL